MFNCILEEPDEFKQKRQKCQQLPKLVNSLEEINKLVAQKTFSNRLLIRIDIHTDNQSSILTNLPNDIINKTHLLLFSQPLEKEGENLSANLTKQHS